MFSLSDLGKQKKTKKVAIGEVTLTVTELPLVLMTRLGHNRKLLASAIAKVTQKSQISAQDLVTERIPVKGSDQVVETQKCSTAEPNEELITKTLEIRQQGIEDISELVLDSDLQYELLQGSVIEFADISVEELKESKELTIPMVLKLLFNILDLNLGDFKLLGNFLSPLMNRLGGAAERTEDEEKTIVAKKS